MALYALTIFLSSFLLFQVQPIIAKIILPWFGGSAAVWNTCMLFFQAALLGGYSYAHILFEKLSPKRQAQLHAALLGISILTLPILPGSSWKPQGGEDPTIMILGLLTATIGLPYFLLSTTGPLLQAWYAREHAGAIPYRLFALSNFASLLALITYPLFVEPRLDANVQGYIWSGAYVVFVTVCATVAWRRRNDMAPVVVTGEAAIEQAPVLPPTPGRKALWIALASCPSVLLLAVTTHMTQDVAAIPFLWIVPLVLYLLTFILTFETSKIYRRWIWMPLLVGSLGMVAWMASTDGPEFSMRQTLMIYGAAMFICSMVCHGELASMKPHPRYLTSFYVCLSVGGALGGLFVSVIAPNFFPAYYEFPFGWWFSGALTVAALVSTSRGKLVRMPGLVLLIVMLLGLGGYAGFWTHTMRRYLSGYRVTERNFYGTLRIEDEGNIHDKTLLRQLLHGTINHGQQFLHPERRREATTYYCASSGVGTAILTRNEMIPQKVGVIGLGTGTLLSYGRIGDEYHVFEINPLVLQLARREFGFLNESRAKTEVHLGDARLTLERMAPMGLDILAVDAFSGDSVPVHLLTAEAMALYLRHLQPNGILAVHISNRYLGLEPVVAAGARGVGKVALEFSDDREESDEVCFGSTWILVMDEATRQNLGAKLVAGRVLEPTQGFRPWTDSFSNLLSVLKK